MIVVDTSALIAILQNEPEADACAMALDSADDLLISAATFAEALIVASHRGLAPQMSALLSRMAFTVAPLSESDARSAVDAHLRWGKGVHPAGLNFGDCFSYVLAKQQGCPLLFVGNDFAQTDIASALAV
jgi:ribonuclease VapC